MDAASSETFTFLRATVRSWRGLGQDAESSVADFFTPALLSTCSSTNHDTLDMTDTSWIV